MAPKSNCASTPSRLLRYWNCGAFSPCAISGAAAPSRSSMSSVGGWKVEARDSSLRSGPASSTVTGTPPAMRLAAAAANLIAGGVPVTVLEAGPDLSEESRASTFHPPTLDMLDRLGAAAPLIAQGLKAPQFQYRNKRDGVLAQFDFGAIADVTGHPYRVQAEQSKLTRILHDRLSGRPNFELQLDAQVQDVRQHGSGVEITIARKGRTERRSGRWLIGADGAGSSVRRSLGIAFEGFTWPERFLVVSTPFDFRAVIPDL